ncbi:unnamed protein product, partial [Ixodes hexagonus]
SDQGIPVRLYKKTIPACHRCGTVGHRADICPRPQAGRCGRCGSQVAPTSEGPAEHDCIPCCLLCGGNHLTGAAGCTGKYRKPIKPGTPPTNARRKSAPKQSPPTKGNTRTSTSTQEQPGQRTRGAKSGTGTKAPTFNAGDFPPLESAQTKVSSWVGAVPGPLSPSQTEVALQRQNAELQRQTKILANKIQELEAKLARLTEPQAQTGSSEPMQQAEPADHDDRASAASGPSSVSQCSGRAPVGHMPLIDHRLENLERTIADMPSKILESVRASFKELWQQELPHMVQSIIPAVTNSVLSTVQRRASAHAENSRSRSRSPRPDSRRRTVFPRQTTGSLEHNPAAPSPETLSPLPEAPSSSGIGRAPQN